LNLSEYTYLLNQPEAVLEKQTDVLEKIVQEFPYFQSARALYLKGLYTQNSFKYNYALKITAAHTTDRSVLFDFITSDSFTALQKQHYEEKTAEILDIKVAESELVEEAPKLEVRENTVEQSIAASIKEATPIETITTPEPEQVELAAPEISAADFYPKDPSVSEQAQQFVAEASATEQTTQTVESESETATETETKLEIGKPLEFSTLERHSFQEWLQLSQFKPIVRDEPEAPTQEHANPDLPETEPLPSEVNFEKQKKNELINKFIESNPRIPQIKHENPIPATFYEPSKADNSMLMTETLARVYLEQKKYQKAIQAYEILILKYPEKSSFFADRILDIKNLQQNNT